MTNLKKIGRLLRCSFRDIASLISFSCTSSVAADLGSSSLLDSGNKLRVVLLSSLCTGDEPISVGLLRWSSRARYGSHFPHCLPHHDAFTEFYRNLNLFITLRIPWRGSNVLKCQSLAKFAHFVEA